MEDNKKRSLIIGVVALLIFVIGATYAYFAVGTTNNFGTTTISATADSVGTVTLSNINSTLSMDLTAADMMRKTVTRYKGRQCTNGTILNCRIWGPYSYYDTLEECQIAFGFNPNESGTQWITNFTCEEETLGRLEHYFATPNGKSTDYDDFIQEIARATVSPNTDTNYYSCDYTLSISHTGTNDMYTRFNTNYTNKSSGQIYLDVDEIDFDWNDGFPSTYSGTLLVSAGHPTSIYAGLAFNNLGDVDQTHLAGTDIAITIQTTSFSCTALEIERLYYNGTNYEDPLDAPGSMPYYVKQVVSEGDVLDTEICAVINSTTVCMPYNAGENYQAYLTQLTNAGATCTDNNKGAYVCTYGLIQIVMDYESSDFVDIYYNDGEHGCSIYEDSEECTNDESPDSEPKDITDPNSR